MQTSEFLSTQLYLATLGMPTSTVKNIGVANGSISGEPLRLIGNSYISLNTSRRNDLELDFTSYITGASSSLVGKFVYPDAKEQACFGLCGDGHDTYSYNQPYQANI